MKCLESQLSFVHLIHYDWTHSSRAPETVRSAVAAALIATKSSAGLASSVVMALLWTRRFAAAL